MADEANIGMEEALEMIEEWETVIVPEIKAFLKDKAYILEDEELRNAFFAGCRFAEEFEKKHGRSF